MRRIVQICLLALVAAPLGALGVASKEIAPDFTLKHFNGENVRLEELRGQVVLLNFWASWCGPCRQEMPVLDQIHQRYEDTGFSVVAVNVEKDADSARKLLEKSQVSFPVLMDSTQSVSRLYNLKAMPSTVVIDRDGNIRYVHNGYKPGDESKYVEVVKALIRE